MGRPTKHYGKFRIRWIDENNVRKSRVFDDKETAALELQREELAVEERRRGLRPAASERRTFAHAADYWERYRAPAKRSEKDDLSVLKQLRPHFGRLDLRDTEAWVAAIDRYKTLKAAKLSEKTIGNHLTLLGSILRAALDLGWLERLPKIKKPAFDIASESYRYLRNEDEIQRFLDGAIPEGPMVYALYATAVYTGLRAGELAGLRWEDVDLATHWLDVLLRGDAVRAELMVRRARETMMAADAIDELERRRLARANEMTGGEEYPDGRPAPRDSAALSWDQESGVDRTVAHFK